MAGDAALSLESLSLESLEGACEEPVLLGTGLGASWGSEVEPLRVALSLLLAMGLLRKGCWLCLVTTGTGTAVVILWNDPGVRRASAGWVRVFYMSPYLLKTCPPSGPQPKT